MVNVKLNKGNENPFYGLRSCLELFNAQNKPESITTDLLNKAWNEAKGKKEFRELFFTLLFSIGDITARQHNIFKGVKKDSGGNANRMGFEVVLRWMFSNNAPQFKKFLNAHLFNEYTCFDFLFNTRIKTDKKRNVLNAGVTLLKDAKYREMLLEYTYSVLKGTNVFDKMLVSKFLTLPRLSARKGHKKMLPETKANMAIKRDFLVELSKLMGWEYTIRGNLCNFKGYRAWRKEFNSMFESVLFTTGTINTFDKNEFIDWYGKLPAQARYRVKNRVLYSKVEGTDTPKWGKMQSWILEWEKYKESKQQEQRTLEEKVRQGQASQDDVAKLEKVKREAKVNVGATNFEELYNEICNNNVDKLKLESFMNKVNLPYNSLVIIDDSGSMSGEPFNFASFMAAVCLVKNPDDDGRNLLGFFNNKSHWHSFIDVAAAETPNWMLRRQVAKVSPKPFVNPHKSFYDNYQCIKQFCNGAFQGGGTRINQIPIGLKDACDANPAILDALKSYPVWTIISDGEWNSLSSPEASMNDFMRRCEDYFGFRPFIVAIDISKMCRHNFKTDRFSGIENMIYIPANPAQIETFLTNFKDIDIADVYTPLQSLYRSNRYQLVRDNTL